MVIYHLPKGWYLASVLQVVGRASRLSWGRLALGRTSAGKRPGPAGETPAPLPEPLREGRGEATFLQSGPHLGFLSIASLGHDPNKELRRGERLGVAESDLHRLEVVGGGGDGLRRRGIIGPGAQIR